MQKGQSSISYNFLLYKFIKELKKKKKKIRLYMF